MQRQIYTEVSRKTEVASLVDLEPGNYLVVPCTAQPGVDIKFLLRIFTDVEFSSGYDLLEVCIGMGIPMNIPWDSRFLLTDGNKKEHWNNDTGME